MTLRIFGMIHADNENVYFSGPDYSVIAKTPRTDSLVRDMLTVWRTSVEVGGQTTETTPEDSTEILTFIQEIGTDYYEAWNNYGRRVSHHTIDAPVITQARYISAGRRLILDSLVNASPC